MARSPLLALAIIFLGFCCPPAQAVDLPLKQPSWAELPAPKRSILAPLAGEWDSFGAIRRQKWLGIAERYPSLSQEEQARLQGRMKIWADLSPEERDLARRNFKMLRRLTPAQLKQRWEEYKNLPPEERERLQKLAKLKTSPKLQPGKKAPASAHTKPVTKSLTAGLAGGTAPAATVGATAPPSTPIAPLLATPLAKPAATTAAGAPSLPPATATP